MVNSDTFATRLKKLMKYYELSASAFSEEIDFNRSTISHLLSGRNKPSLDFVMKVLDRFPEVTISWLLYDKGDFPSNQESLSFEERTDQNYKAEVVEEEPINKVLESAIPKPHEESIIKSIVSKSSEKEIKRIVIFYTDASFESYEN